MNYAQQTQGVTTPPAGHFLLKDEHWATGHKGKPLCSVRLGIRLLSDADNRYVTSLAKEKTDRTGDSDQLKRWMVVCAVAVAICSEDDASLAHDLFPCPDEQIPTALKPETINAIFDELERLTIATSPIYPEATDDELTELVEVMADGGLEILEDVSPVRASRARRLFRYLLDELKP